MTAIYMPPVGHRGIASQLARECELRKIINEGKSLTVNDVIINWGNSECNRNINGNFTWLNHPGAVALACNKLLTHKAFKECEVPTVEFTEDYDEAVKWFKEGYVVYTRKLLKASCGRGIELAIPGVSDGVVKGPLYTKRFTGKEEYRVHVFCGKIIFGQQKRKRREIETSKYIKNVDNGYVFCIENVNVPNKCKDAAIAAIDALGLDFGAVDLGYSVKQDMAVVYEVNTRPNLEGSSFNAYVETITNL